MLYQPKIYTVESVTSGHPDKICDQVSDAVLDACLSQDPQSRVAVEALGGHGVLVIAGEVTTKAKVDFKKVAHQVYQDIGYGDNLRIITKITCQSSDIAQGVDLGGAGDQGIMYGYATSETKQFLPGGVVLVHQLTKGLQELRESGQADWLGPDGKAQVTFQGKRIKSILISCQHNQTVNQQQIRQTLIAKLIRPLVDHSSQIEILVNPTGKFVCGGFRADTGLTGRKIMVDTYGGLAPHGGGCFSGKDPSKVDRSASYMARFVTKNIVASGRAKQCLVAVAYAIGRAEPLMVSAINEKGRSLTSFVKRKFDFRPQAIIERLDLLRPIYRPTATYGHFGKPDLPWEQILTHW